MQTIFSHSVPVLAAAVLALAPVCSHAQAGPFVGLGAGVGRVAEPDARAARFAPSLDLRAGWRFNPNLAVMLEGSLNGIGSPNPEGPIVDPGINGGTYSNRQLQTGAVLVAAQLGTPALYVRLGVGISRHAFTSYRPLPADGYEPRTSHEAGPAAGIAIGRRVGLIPGFPVAVEGVGIWSGGEDSSSARWSAGVQVTTDFHF